jgi:hypothetical protein
MQLKEIYIKKYLILKNEHVEIGKQTLLKKEWK